ncbi:MAG: peptide-methionine (R)-S-oxide reductase MsrB [Leptospiraceae bacterium]|nr:peptide-methionine (R)-S-oxide reductase MsrB [Leptospiraceae bacterium]
MEENLPKTEEEWKKILSTDAYQVLRKKGTERAFTGKYHDNKEKGVYICAGCGQELFSSDTKFDSGTGWPSFFEPISSQNVGTETDKSFFMTRTEVHCSRCGGHLGHVFSDGPKPTGLRYCINSVSLGFKKKP